MLVGLSDKTEQTLEMAVQISGAVQGCVSVQIKFKAMLTEVGDGDGKVVQRAEGQIVFGGAQAIERHLA